MKTLLRSISAALLAIVAAIAVYLGGEDMPPPPVEDDTPVEEDPLPNPVTPDPRMGKGYFPFVGFGADALRACAPEDGGDWDVQVLVVDDARSDILDGPGTKNAVLAEADSDVDVDLVVLVYTTGGHNRGRGGGAWRNLARRSCIYDAGHTAPTTYYQANSEHVRGGGFSNLVIRGLGFLPTQSQDFFDSNYFYGECLGDSHIDLMSFAFGGNDHIRTVGELGGGDGCFTERTTVARVVVGPSGKGNAGRGGGPSRECREQSWGHWFGFENIRRNPDGHCFGRLNVTGVLCFNTTDCGRYGDRALHNLRNILAVGGPVTGCARDGALTLFEPYGEEGSRFFLDDVTYKPAPDCGFGPVTNLWGRSQTVFRYNQRGTPVDTARRAVGPHPDPEYPIPPLADLAEHLPQVVGANWGLSCTGEWVRRVNDLDGESFRRFEQDNPSSVRWTGRRQYEGVMGPILTPKGTPCPDSNGNGIPDAVETRWGHSDPGRLGESGRPVVLEWLEGYGVAHE